MNYEEAVEVILRAQPYEDCPTCVDSPAQKSCDRCRGSGQRISNTYRVACEVLDRPLPKQPSNLFYDIREDMAKDIQEREDEYILRMLEQQ